MSYLSIVQMAKSQSLLQRITAAAANEGIDNPGAWVAERSWRLAATPGWADAWAYAVDSATVNRNPDTGACDDVINDSMILAAVQALVAAETPEGPSA